VPGPPEGSAHSALGSTIFVVCQAPRGLGFLCACIDSFCDVPGPQRTWLLPHLDPQFLWYAMPPENLASSTLGSTIFVVCQAPRGLGFLCACINSFCDVPGPQRTWLLSHLDPQFLWYAMSPENLASSTLGSTIFVVCQSPRGLGFLCTCIDSFCDVPGPQRTWLPPRLDPQFLWCARPPEDLS
jgi:hypothetical protein